VSGDAGVGGNEEGRSEWRAGGSGGQVWSADEESVDLIVVPDRVRVACLYVPRICCAAGSLARGETRAHHEWVLDTEELNIP
jgi:hypothetical protein